MKNKFVQNVLSFKKAGSKSQLIKFHKALEDKVLKENKRDLEDKKAAIQHEVLRMEEELAEYKEDREKEIDELILNVDEKRIGTNKDIKDYAYEYFSMITEKIEFDAHGDNLSSIINIKKETIKAIDYKIKRLDEIMHRINNTSHHIEFTPVVNDEDVE
jgi:vacuolar-type H+-ATPase subunit D/Vma8